MRTLLRLESAGQFIGIRGAIVLRTLSLLAALIVSKQCVVARCTSLVQALTHLRRIRLPNCTASA